MYSQNNEDDLILPYLKGITLESPSFLDVGAFDPKVFSNTRVLVEAGWYGTYVEPAPINFDAFLTEYRENDNILLVNAALSVKSELIKFYDANGDAISTSSENHATRWRGAGVKYREYFTKTITWDELLEVTGNSFNVLSLDVEGLNYDLFMAMPIHKLDKLEVLIVEHDGYVEDMKAVAASAGLGRVLALNGENIIFTK